MGDRVVHAARPEWGPGQVVSAKRVDQDGESVQKLSIRFDRAGLKTLSTAMAKLLPADGSTTTTDAGAGATATATAAQPSAAPIEVPTAKIHDQLTPAEIDAVMIGLPESATDPFATPADRLRASLTLYRFKPEGGSLLDWAAMQSGLTDPLSRFSRHELEEWFTRFQRALTAHVKDLALGLVRSDPAAVAQIAREAAPEAQQVLRRLDTRR
ncbi:MAG: DUF3553 domain-containing protein [Planctomycetota bacterium]